MSKGYKLSLPQYDWSFALLYDLYHLVLRFSSCELQFFKTSLDNLTQHRRSIVKAHDHSIPIKVCLTILENTIDSQVFVLNFLQLRQIVLGVYHNVCQCESCKVL